MYTQPIHVSCACGPAMPSRRRPNKKDATNTFQTHFYIEARQFDQMAALINPTIGAVSARPSFPYPFLLRWTPSLDHKSDAASYGRIEAVSTKREAPLCVAMVWLRRCRRSDRSVHCSLMRLCGTPNAIDCTPHLWMAACIAQRLDIRRSSSFLKKSLVPRSRTTQWYGAPASDAACKIESMP